VGGTHWLTVNNGTFIYNAGGSFGGGGNVVFNSATLNLGADLSNTAVGLGLNSVTVNGPGLLTNASGQTLTMTWSTLNGPVVNQGLLVATYSNTLGGALPTCPGARCACWPTEPTIGIIRRI